ncbi:MAG: hypothetical protein HYV16_07040 [Gammaproteobacteria bacterium]|nr:hypothetical protein [Gammaproteobacteria bacterium]
MSLKSLASCALLLISSLQATSALADAPGVLPAPKPAAIDPMQMVRENLGPMKQAFIDKNLKLSQGEASKFWPLYFAYQEGLGKLNYRVQSTQKSMLRSWNTLSETAVKDMVREAAAIDEERGKLTRETMKKFLAALPAKTVAQYFVLEYKFRSVINYDMAAGLPLVR